MFIPSDIKQQEESPITKNQIGFMKFTRTLMMKNYDAVRQILSHVVVFSAEFIDFGHTIEYQVFSDKFDPIPDHEVPPYYVAYIKDGEVEFKRQ